jgi:hypothetical protein
MSLKKCDDSLGIHMWMYANETKRLVFEWAKDAAFIFGTPWAAEVY